MRIKPLATTVDSLSSIKMSKAARRAVEALITNEIIQAQWQCLYQVQRFAVANGQTKVAFRCKAAIGELSKAAS